MGGGTIGGGKDYIPALKGRRERGERGKPISSFCLEHGASGAICCNAVQSTVYFGDRTRGVFFSPRRRLQGLHEQEGTGFEGGCP